MSTKCPLLFTQQIGRGTRAEDKQVQALLDRCTNMFGRIDKDIRRRLSAVLKNQNDTTWDNAYSIIVNGRTGRTLWQAVIAVDPFFPKVGPAVGADGKRTSEWSQVPSRTTLLDALLYAVTEFDDKRVQ